MDLSGDIQNLHEPFKFIKSRNESVSSVATNSKTNFDFGIIDINRINFESCTEYKLVVILQLETYTIEIDDEDYYPSSKSFQKVLQNDVQKNIYSRTFTRPKKRFTRPSIEKYNEEVYGKSNELQNDRVSFDSMRKSMDGQSYLGSSTIQEVSEPITSSNPLNFDLSQPTNSYYFENVLANAADIDSFQNMSPPSLVNSMCSSTFANLMESSFIKNDPVLREIRDTDYTETVLLQDSEPPMFQSITESCSSLNSDTPEMSYHGTFRKTVFESDKTDAVENINNSIDLNATYEKTTKTDLKPKNPENTVKEIQVNTRMEPNFNGTFRRTPKSNNTFRRSNQKNITSTLNSTFEIYPNEKDQDTTPTPTNNVGLGNFENKNVYLNNCNIINDTVESMKKQLSETVQITDLNRLSYCLDDENIRLDTDYTENDDINRTINMKRRSLGCSTGSADSLDRMSSLSNSSRGSNKMLDMADVDAIVEMQERSLQQVMSTPKPNTGTKKLWENNFISPIISNERLSDSDMSSNDEYKSVKSTFSKVSLEEYDGKSVKSLGYLGSNIDTKLKTAQRSAYTSAGQKPLQAVCNTVRGSYSNLKAVQSNIPGSQPNIYKPTGVSRATASTTNLLSMGHKLKGSYTSLRPISSNLPVAPPITPQLNSTLTLPKATNPNVTQNIDGHSKVVEVHPMPRERVVADNNFIKPQLPRASGLPRPTGIPRPSSRIPGPRSNLR
ncbi:hypothetical protein NQ318_013171 [Aromia moschata]|uniref:Uncharacterized protein n=1 Tax=Aromia moschata TaxID=1265417 RepID=A0AAV8Y5G5_9CUCU|nr:hypothetical protein NQ318_013171 [Aromia moschata]